MSIRPEYYSLASILNDPHEHESNKSLFIRTWGRLFKHQAPKRLSLPKFEQMKQLYQKRDLKRVRSRFCGEDNGIDDVYYKEVVNAIGAGIMPSLYDLDRRVRPGAINDRVYDLLDRTEQVLNWRITKPDISGFVLQNSSQRAVINSRQLIGRAIAIANEYDQSVDRMRSSIEQFAKLFKKVRTRERLCHVVAYVTSIKKIQDLPDVIHRTINIAGDHAGAIRIIQSHDVPFSGLTVEQWLINKLNDLRAQCEDSIVSAAASGVVDLLNGLSHKIDLERTASFLRLLLKNKGRDTTSDLVMDLCVHLSVVHCEMEKYCSSLKRLNSRTLHNLEEEKADFSTSSTEDELQDLKDACKEASSLSVSIVKAMDLLIFEEVCDRSQTDRTINLCDQLIQASLVKRLSRITLPTQSQMKLLFDLIPISPRDELTTNIIGLWLKERSMAFLAAFHSRQIKCLEDSLTQDKWTPMTAIPYFVQQLTEFDLGSEEALTLIEHSHQETNSFVEHLNIKESYSVSTSTVFFTILVGQYWELMTYRYKILCDPTCFKYEVLTRLIDFFKFYNSRICQLLIGAGAIDVAGLRTITARNLALAVRSLQFVIGNFMNRKNQQEFPPVICSYLNCCPTCSCASIKLLENLNDQLKSDYLVHIDEILNKILVIVELTLLEKGFSQYNETTSATVVADICSKLRVLDKSLRTILSASDRRMTLEKIKNKFRPMLERCTKQATPSIPAHYLIRDLKELFCCVETLADYSPSEE
ncbi:hypothetical protein ACOME3_010276 [Neoechinorhynchus agilis]